MFHFASRQRRVALICLAMGGLGAVVAGCASPYGKNVLFGGFREQAFDASHWRVEYDGNGHTPKEQVWAYWMHRCAELTRQSGFEYFALLPDTWTPAAAMAPQAASSAPVAWRPAPGVHLPVRQAIWVDGADVRRVATRSGGGYSYIYVPGARITTWHTKGVVAMFNAPVAPDTLLVMQAQAVLDELGPYVHGQMPHPADRDEVFARGLRWVSASGQVLSFMQVPVAPGPAASEPMRYWPAPEAMPVRGAGVRS